MKYFVTKGVLWKVDAIIRNAAIRCMRYSINQTGEVIALLLGEKSCHIKCIDSLRILEWAEWVTHI